MVRAEVSGGVHLVLIVEVVEPVLYVLVGVRHRQVILQLEQRLQVDPLRVLVLALRRESLQQTVLVVFGQRHTEPARQQVEEAVNFD